MIVTGLHRTYPTVVEDIKNGQFNHHWAISAALREITVGDWPKLSAASLEGYLDFIVGTYNDMIVTAYRTSGFTLVDYDGAQKIRFIAEDIVRSPRPSKDHVWGQKVPAEHEVKADIKSYDPAAWLIGCPIPGGSWKRGESRGTRRYLLEEYLRDHPDLSDRQQDVFEERSAEFMCKHFAGKMNFEGMDFPQLDRVHETTARTAADDGVTVVRHPGGTVVVTIPTGVRAQINIEPTT